MKRKHMLAAVATAAALAGGTAAIAATDDRKAAEDAVLADAAERLDVTPEELRSALAAAEDAQLDDAVKAGRLTQEQADELKQRRADSGLVLGFGPGGPHGHGHHRGPGGPGGPALLDDAAAALGITREQLFQRLQDGKTLAQIAQAEGKSLADVKDAVKKAATERLDAELEAGRITQEQGDAIAEHLAEHVERLGELSAFPGHREPPFERDDAAYSPA